MNQQINDPPGFGLRNYSAPSDPSDPGRDKFLMTAFAKQTSIARKTIASNLYGKENTYVGVVEPTTLGSCSVPWCTAPPSIHACVKRVCMKHMSEFTCSVCQTTSVSIIRSEKIRITHPKSENYYYAVCAENDDNVAPCKANCGRCRISYPRHQLYAPIYQSISKFPYLCVNCFDTDLDIDYCAMADVDEDPVQQAPLWLCNSENTRSRSLPTTPVHGGLIGKLPPAMLL